MHPILVDFGTHDLPGLGPTHLFLPTYGVLFAFSALVAWAWFLRRARSIGVPSELAFNASFYGLLTGLIGAKLTLVAVEWRHYAAHPEDLLASLRSAGVLMGGVAAGAVAFIWYVRRHGLPLFALGDAVAAPLALAQAVGRLGCTAAGCCWGRPLHGHARFALVFTDPDAATQTGVPLGVPLFPYQPLQAANDLVLAGVLTWLWRRRERSGMPEGTVFWWYLVLYGTTRAILEHWRGDAGRGLWLDGRVSTSQLFSLLAVAVGATMLARGLLRRHREAPAS